MRKTIFDFTSEKKFFDLSLKIHTSISRGRFTQKFHILISLVNSTSEAHPSSLLHVFVKRLCLTESQISIFFINSFFFGPESHLCEVLLSID
jgi:hypothetical protein